MLGACWGASIVVGSACPPDSVSFSNQLYVAFNLFISLKTMRVFCKAKRWFAPENQDELRIVASQIVPPRQKHCPAA